MEPFLDQLLVFVVSVLAGLGLMSLATRLLSEGLQLCIGETVRRIINWLDQNDGIASVVGAFTSLMIQSRISTSVMAVSYASSRLMNLRQMVFFLLGSTAGTFLTPWIFIADGFRLDLLFLAIGVLPMLHARWDRLAGFGRSVFALGLMLLGFDVIAFGASQPDTIALLIRGALSWMPDNLLGTLSLVLLALPFCLVFRSTVALLGGVMALVFSGILPAKIAVILTLGFNLGAVLPSILAAWGAGDTAKRGVFYFSGVYLFAVLLLAVFFHPYHEWISKLSEQMGVFSSNMSLTMAPMLSVLLTHLTVNSLAIFIGFLASPLIERISALLVVLPKEKEIQRLKFLGRPSQFVPSLALEQASQEVKKMAALVQTTLHVTGDNLKSGDESLEKRALKYEGITDSILEELTVFLTKVMQSSLSKKQSFESAYLMHFAVELEKIADNCEDILELNKKLEGSPELSEDIQKYFSAAVDCYEHVFPMLTDHFHVRSPSQNSFGSIDPKQKSVGVSSGSGSIDVFLEELEEYVNESLNVYDQLLIQGLSSHQDGNSAVPILNCIRKIVENIYSIVDLRQRFLLPDADFERA